MARPPAAVLGAAGQHPDQLPRYSIDTPPSVESVAGLGRVNLLFTVIAVVALLVYWVAWWQARRIQKPYPISRLVCWTIGWGLVLYLNISGFWEYSSASFTFHMVEHMSINMLAPVLIVVGGPITLFLNVLPVTRETSMPRVRDAIVAMTNWKALKVILHPLVIGFLFVASLYVIYFSDLFGAMMRYHWAHQFMMLHYLIVGLLFYSQIIGTDKAPRSRSPPRRAARVHDGGDAVPRVLRGDHHGRHHPGGGNSSTVRCRCRGTRICTRPRNWAVS